MELVSTVKSFGGEQRRYTHKSTCLGCTMTFSVYVPPAALHGREEGKKGGGGNSVPVVVFLSGLTCTDENFSTKSGAQRAASELGIALVIPDTSPRGLKVDGEDDSYDFGSGAGFYLNAMVDKWKGYRMEEYVTTELPALLRADADAAGDDGAGKYLDLDRCGITGHSMGGHGALTLGIKYASAYKSVSAFSPICSPTQCPWGVKALTGYLGDTEDAKAIWPRYDTCELLRGGAGAEFAAAAKKIPILVDQGTDDNFLVEQLKTVLLEEAVEAMGCTNVTIRMQKGYDHSYYFIASFIGEHLAFHAKHLK